MLLQDSPISKAFTHVEYYLLCYLFIKRVKTNYKHRNVFDKYLNR